MTLAFTSGWLDMRPAARSLCLACWCLLLAVLIGLPSLLYPFGADSAIMDYVGRGILDGYLPYRDSFDHKQPLVHLVYAFGALISGRSQWGIRAIDLMAVLSCGLLVGYRISIGMEPHVRWFYRSVAALLCTVLYFVFFDYWRSAQPEQWLLVLILSAWCLVASSNGSSRRRAFQVGVLLGFAVLLKLTAALIGFGIGCIGLGYAAKRADSAERLGRLRSAFIWGVACLCGFSTVLAFAVSALIFLGIGPAAWEANILWNTFYALYVPFLELPPDWFLLATGVFWIVALLSIGLGYITLRTERDSIALTTQLVGLESLVLLALSFTTVCLQGKFLAYHWSVLIPFWTALTLWGVVINSPRSTKLVTLISTVFALAVFYVSPTFRWPQGAKKFQALAYRSHVTSVLRFLRGEQTHADFLQSYAYQCNNRSAELVGQLVNQLGSGREALCVIGEFCPEIYGTYKARCPSKYFWDFPLYYTELNTIAAVELGLNSAGAVHSKRLRSEPPDFLVTTALNNHWLYTKDRWESLYNRLLPQYRPHAAVSDQIVFVRNGFELNQRFRSEDYPVLSSWKVTSLDEQSSSSMVRGSLLRSTDISSAGTLPKVVTAASVLTLPQAADIEWTFRWPSGAGTPEIELNGEKVSGLMAPELLPSQFFKSNFRHHFLAGPNTISIRLSTTADTFGVLTFERGIPFVVFRDAPK